MKKYIKVSEYQLEQLYKFLRDNYYPDQKLKDQIFSKLKEIN